MVWYGMAWLVRLVSSEGRGFSYGWYGWYARGVVVVIGTVSMLGGSWFLPRWFLTWFFYSNYTTLLKRKSFLHISFIQYYTTLYEKKKNKREKERMNI